MSAHPRRRQPAAAAVAGLLLAAGAGTRLGRAKALVRFDRQLLVEHGVRLLGDGGCQPVVVVLGAAADEVRRHADLHAAEIVVNQAWSDGMATSLRCGLSALAARGAGAVVVALVDQPLVGPAAVERLISAWRAGAVAAVATYDGRERNPVLLDGSLWDAAAEHARGDVGARALLRARPDLVTRVACDGTGDPDDIDTPDELARLQAAAATRR